MKKIKILVITKSMEGGVGTFLLNFLTLSQIDKRFEIKILVLQKPQFRSLPKQTDSFSVFCDTTYPLHYSLNYSTLKLLYCELQWVQNEMAAYHPQVVMAIDTHCNFLALFLKTFFIQSSSLILTHHNNVTETSQKRMSSPLLFLAKSLGKIFYKKADAVLAVSRGVAHDIQQFYSIKRHITIINYGISPGKRISFHSHKRNAFISICRLVEQKDPFTLIRAFALVAKQHPNITLSIIGDGVLRNNIESLIKKLGLTKSICLLGWREDARKYLEKADIFILSSKREGLPNVLLEALSCGKPIIASDVPYGPAEILGNGKYGIIVPPKDKKALANAMSELLQSRSTYIYYAKQSAKRSKQYSIDKMYQSYIQLIYSLIDKQER